MDKPKMYQNKTNKSFHNNRLIYTTYDNHQSNINPIDIRNKINNILNSNTFIYSKTVNINLSGSIIKRKIIGTYGDNLITIDNEYIPINNIQDIYI